MKTALLTVTAAGAVGMGVVVSLYAGSSQSVLILLGATALSGTAGWVWRREVRAYGIPGVLSLVTVDLALGFGVGGLYYGTKVATDARVDVSSEAVLSAILLGLAGSIALTIGYMAPRRLSFFRGVGRRIDKATEGADSFCSIVVLEAIGWVARFGQLGNGTYFHAQDMTSGSAFNVIIAMLSNFPLLALALLFSRQWSRGQPARAAWVLTVVEIAWSLPSGERASVVGLLLAILLLRARWRLRLPKGALVIAGATCVFVLFPVVATYRGDNAAYSQDVRHSAEQAVTQTFAGGRIHFLSSGLESTFSRFSDVLSAAVVFEGQSPHKSNYSLSDYLTTVGVPRVLAPNKPDPGRYGNEFGRASGMVRPSDMTTSIAVSQPLHAYLDGGWLSVPIFCFISGICYRAVMEALLVGAGTVRSSLYATYSFAVATSVGTIWPLGFVGLSKALMIAILGLVFAAFVARIATPGSLDAISAAPDSCSGVRVKVGQFSNMRGAHDSSIQA